MPYMLRRTLSRADFMQAEQLFDGKFIRHK
jgi:hypothetical protein